MICLDSQRLNWQQIDNLELIHDFLPLEDQLFTLPRISKLWYSISQKKIHRCFQKLTNNEYTNDQLNIIIHLIKTHHFIEGIKSSQHITRNLYTSEIKVDNHLSLTVPLWKKSHDFFRYEITWDSNILKLIDKNQLSKDFLREVFCNNYIIKISSIFLNRFSCTSLNIKIKINCHSCHKRKLAFWSKIAKNDTKSRQINQLFECAIELKLKISIMYIVNLNINPISKIGFNHIFNGKLEVAFNCDENGQIIGVKKNEGLFLKIKRLQANNTNESILVWESNDTEVIKDSPLITDYLRWYVFSLTVQKLEKSLIKKKSINCQSLKIGYPRILF